MNGRPKRLRDMGLLARNTLFLSVAKFFSVAIYAVFGLALPRFFGDAHVDEVGLYTLLSSLVFFGGMLTSFGIPLLVTREVARNHDAAPDLFARGRAGMTLGFVISVVLLAGWLLLEAWANDNLTSGAFLEREGRVFALFVVAMAIVYCDAVGALGDAVFQGFERMALPAAVEVLTGLLRGGGAFLVLMLVPVGWKLGAIYGCFLFGAALRAILIPRLLRARVLRGRPSNPVSMRDAWRIIAQSGFIALFRMLRMLRNRLDVLLLGVLYVSLVEGVPEADVDVARAIYGQAMRVAIVFHTFTFAFNTALFPRLAQLTSAQDTRAGAHALYGRAVRIQAFWAVPLALGVFFYADVVAGWFGDKYLHGSPEDGVLHGTGTVLRVLLIAVLLDCLGGPVGFLMLGEKRMERRIPLLGALVASCSLVTNLLLIPSYGILGAAWSSAITAAVEFAVKLGVVWRLYGSPFGVLWRTMPYYAVGGAMFAGLSWAGAEDAVLWGVLGGASFYLGACLLTRQVDPAILRLMPWRRGARA